MYLFSDEWEEEAEVVVGKTEDSKGDIWDGHTHRTALLQRSLNHSPTHAGTGIHSEH